MIFSIFKYEEDSIKTINYSSPVTIVIRLLPDPSKNIPSIFIWNPIVEQWDLLENTLLNNETLIAKTNNTGIIGIFLKK